MFTISNSIDGFHMLLEKIQLCTAPQGKIERELETTGHYSYNILGFLLDNVLPTYVLKPLRTNLYRKSLSLRKPKTDRVNAQTIATLLLSDTCLKPYTNTAFHNQEPRLLTRYCFDKVNERTRLKSSISRLVCLLFPELEKPVSSLHLVTIYALLEEFPGAKQIAKAHLTRLSRFWETSPKVVTVGILLLLSGTLRRPPLAPVCLPNLWNCNTPSSSSGNWMLKSMRLKRKKAMMKEIHSPITTILGIGFRMAP